MCLFRVSTLSNFQMYPIYFPSRSFPFKDYKEKRLLKGNNPSYHHTVILSSLGLMLKRCLLVVLPIEENTHGITLLKKKMVEMMRMMQQLVIGGN